MPLFPPAVGRCRQQLQADLRQDACIVWRLYSAVSSPTTPGRARREKPFKMAAAARFRPRCFRQAPEKTADSLPPRTILHAELLRRRPPRALALSPFRNARPSGWASTRRRSPRPLGFPGARSEAGRTRRASLRRGRHGATESGERAAPRWRNPRPGWIPTTWRSQETRRRRIKARPALGSWGF